MDTPWGSGSQLTSLGLSNFPIFDISTPQVSQNPWILLLPFFIASWTGSLILLLDLHLKQ